MWQFWVVCDCRSRKGSEAFLYVQPVPALLVQERCAQALGVGRGALTWLPPSWASAHSGHHRSQYKFPAGEHLPFELGNSLLA